MCVIGSLYFVWWSFFSDFGDKSSSFSLGGKTHSPQLSTFPSEARAGHNGGEGDRRREPDRGCRLVGRVGVGRTRRGKRVGNPHVFRPPKVKLHPRSFPLMSTPPSLKPPPNRIQGSKGKFDLEKSSDFSLCKMPPPPLIALPHNRPLWPILGRSLDRGGFPILTPGNGPLVLI